MAFEIPKTAYSGKIKEITLGKGDKAVKIGAGAALLSSARRTFFVPGKTSTTRYTPSLSLYSAELDPSLVTRA